MHSNDHSVLTQALAWREAGQRCVLVTVRQTYGASPRPPGAMAAISAQGQIVGSVSGGCVEDDLLDEVRAGAFWAPGAPAVALREYGCDAAERTRYRLPCGHSLKLAVETNWPTAPVAQALAAMAAHRPVLRHLRYDSGEVTLTQAPDALAGHPALREDAQGLTAVWGPRLRLLLIGASEVARYLAPIAQSLGYAVTVCDPRDEYRSSWSQAGVTLTAAMPDDVVQAFACDARTAVVTVSHDPKLDDLGLMEALRTPAFYVGALGSQANSGVRRDRLRLFDLSEPQLARLHAPVGLAIGSRTPAEIAVSVAAELVAVQRAQEQADLAAQVAQGAPVAHVAQVGPTPGGANEAPHTQPASAASHV